MPSDMLNAYTKKKHQRSYPYRTMALNKTRKANARDLCAILFAYESDRPFYRKLIAFYGCVEMPE